ncbi:MAG: hypothetical protein ACRDPY_21905 [Streptosporangiaceae bacterium]
MSGPIMTGIRPDSAGPALPYRFRDVVLSEWTKARSVRSTWFTLQATAVIVIGAGALIAAGTASHYYRGTLADRVGFDPTNASFYSLDFGQLAGRAGDPAGQLGVQLGPDPYQPSGRAAPLVAARGQGPGVHRHRRGDR